MGVPGLHEFLSTYGEVVDFTKPCENDRALIIDGPALAYNIWRTERLREGDYRLFEKALTQFIRRARASFKIERACFDGYLPKHKEDIRAARAQASLNRIRRNQGSTIESVPPPAFVVSLMQDVLRKVGVPCSVVLEEADSACARLTHEIAKDQGCYLLSLDSDMHCFDLGENGYYLPCDSLIVTETSFTGSVFNIRKTQQRLGVGLVELATLMGTEGTPLAHRPASEAMKMITENRVMITQEERERVRRQFSLSEHAPQSLAQDLQDMLDVGMMYGRFAEVLTTGHVWLPQLFEDINQASAWDIGMHYRTAAYGELRKYQPNFEPVEQVRRSQTVSARPISLNSNALDTKVVPTDAQNVFILLMKTLLAKHALGQNEYHAFIIMFVGSYPCSQTRLSVTLMHLLAHWQALIYSFTMLLQALKRSSWPTQAALYDLPTYLMALHHLRTGHNLQDLTKAHAKQVSVLLTEIGYTPPSRYRKKARSG